jgi:hypothetical protein
MKIPFAGGCVCGAIRYECASEPLAMLKCHCRDCQQITGGPYVPAVIVPLRAFKITQGELRYFSTPSQGGGHNKRGFCPACGSRITGAENPERGFIGVTASSMDGPSWFKPTMDIFVSDAHPWDLMDPNLPKFPDYAPRK